jgi:ketosteroid isomerase-like protein
MLEPVRRVVRFIETRDRAWLDHTYTADAEILDSFGPLLFCGPDAARCWADGLVNHLADHHGLSGVLGAAQEFAARDDAVVFSQPVTWRFEQAGSSLIETGALVVLAVHQNGRWLIRRSAWAVLGSQRTSR